VAFFIKIDNEPIVQTNDKTRISVERSFVTGDDAFQADTEIVIDPGDGTGEQEIDYDVLYLDHAYTSAATRTITAKMRAAGGGAWTEKTASISVLAPATENLFSDDAALQINESNIMSFLREGRNSFLDVHRRAQAIILDWLDAQGIHDDDDVRLTSAAIVDTQEVKEWATFVALRLIFEDASNAVDDIFSQKAEHYEAREIAARNRAKGIILDLDGDGEADETDRVVITSSRMVRE
jgi:hypothetical protein